MIVRRAVSFVVVAIVVSGGILWWVAGGDDARIMSTLGAAGAEAHDIVRGNP